MIYKLIWFALKQNKDINYLIKDYKYVLLVDLELVFMKEFAKVIVLLFQGKTPLKIVLLDNLLNVTALD